MTDQSTSAPLTEQELNELGWCGDTAQRPILPDERQEAENIVTRLLPRAVAELRRLRAIVDKLPVTADGVPVYHGMKAWYPGDNESGTVTFHVCAEGGFSAIAACYSTREAADAARKGKE